MIRTGLIVENPGETLLSEMGQTQFDWADGSSNVNRSPPARDVEIAVNIPYRPDVGPGYIVCVLYDLRRGVVRCTFPELSPERIQLLPP